MLHFMMNKCKLCGKETKTFSGQDYLCYDCWINLDCDCGLEKL